MDIFPNFFTKAAVAPAPSPAVTGLQIAFVNDPKFRAEFGMWLYERFTGLSSEYKKHGRFLTLHEITDPDSPLDF